jgi:FkbM family methyltransferase
MDIRPRSRIRNKISHILNKLRNRIENENPGGPERNGEEHFLQELAAEYHGKPIVAFDIGANVGEYGDVLLKEVKKNTGVLELHSFEPLAHVKAVGSISRVAVSDIEGSVTMYSRGSTDTTSSMYRGKNMDRKYGVAKEVTVQTIRLDSYSRKHAITHIDLLKIDVQGNELKVLRGLGEYLRPDFVKYIQLEYDSTYVDAAIRLFDMYAILEGHGYRVCKVYRKHLVLQLQLFEFQLGASFLIVRVFGVGLVMTSPE